MAIDELSLFNQNYECYNKRCKATKKQEDRWDPYKSSVGSPNFLNPQCGKNN